ncbi:MAG: 4-(cytidine 5'-diphospho)-2-C-methyl-D-erythritol kinase [Novosphingobium sp.]|nr:4-(cytidine 5'-diphospho)-2-C-methyl-D-erythritol kinase [Novosphingobium sp.]
MLSKTAYAKINLALHVRARRDDGYHELETLFAFVDRGDELHVAPADDVTLTVTGPYAAQVPADDDNLVLRAARALHQEFGRDEPEQREWDKRLGTARGAAITLVKNLPVASGVGGGSADAGAAIRGLSELWELPDDYQRHLAIAATLGADVPACVGSRTAIGTGTGVDLDLIFDSDLTGAPVLLVNPGQAVPTGPVFKGWDGVDRGAMPQGSVREIALAGRNDLEAPAIALCPAIADVLSALRETAPWLTRMSGSGATCFALYETPEACADASERIARAHAGWWQMTGLLR